MRTVTLEDVAEWGSGGTPKRGIDEYFGNGTPWLSIADLNDGIVDKTKESLTESGIANSSAKIVPKGTIFVAMYGSIGKLGIASRDMCTSQAIAYAKPRQDIIDQSYLFQYLLAERSKLQAIGRGGTQMNIGQADLKKWPIPLPALAEQRRIAAILEQAEAVRTKRRQILAHLDGLTQSILHDMLNKSVNTREFALSEISDISSGITKGRRTSEPTKPTPYLAVLNVQAGHLNMRTVKTIEATETEIVRYALCEGDLVLTEGGDPDKLGRGTLWRNELPLCLHQNHVFRVRVKVNNVVPEYLAHFTASPAARSYFLRAAKQTTGIASINKTQLKSLPVKLPSLETQREFAARVKQVDAQRAVVQRALDADNELFASLQSKAFRGEL